MYPEYPTQKCFSLDIFCKAFDSIDCPTSLCVDWNHDIPHKESKLKRGDSPAQCTAGVLIQAGCVRIGRSGSKEQFDWRSSLSRSAWATTHHTTNALSTLQPTSRHTPLVNTTIQRPLRKTEKLKQYEVVLTSWLSSRAVTALRQGR